MTDSTIDKYYYSNKKRIIDIILALLGLIIVLPIFIIAYPILLLVIKKPIIFKQKRFGKNKKNFTIYKIKTMKNGSANQQTKLLKLSSAPYPMFKIENDPRFHILGKILSKTGLDELPQLANILKGEMSFVGPRPLPVNEAKKLSSDWNFRYNVKPGILSNWALSTKRYDSLDSWMKLEKETLKYGSITNDIKFIYSAFIEIILIKIFGKIKKLAI